MDTQSEIQFLESLTDFGIKLGLEKTRYLLERFGNPHNFYPSVLIAGTNGKGSVARTLSNILTSAGYRTGLYTSPHLVYLGERIQIDGKEITEEEICFKIRQLKKILASQPLHLYPTFFEALTVIAFSYFADMKIDILVCEVGMGGRFDATNVLPSSLEIITRIGLDHIQYLGNTYEEIANEKAGIIKKGTPVVCARQRVPVMDVIKRKAKDKNAKIYSEGRDFWTRRIYCSSEGQMFDFYGKKGRLKGIRTPFKGKHQMSNMAVSVQAALLLREQGFKIADTAVYKGIETTFWPCRFQILNKKPLIIIDGAHNVDGIKALLNTISELYPDKKFSFLMGILKDKDWKGMLSTVLKSKNLKEIVFTLPENERAISPEVLKQFILKKKKDIDVKVIQDPSEAIRYIKETQENWCICGSLYLCGDIIKCNVK